MKKVKMTAAALAAAFAFTVAPIVSDIAGDAAGNRISAPVFQADSMAGRVVSFVPGVRPAYAQAEEAVDYKKQTIIRKVAMQYLVSHNLNEYTPVRFDVIAIDKEIRWHKNAL